MARKHTLALTAADIFAEHAPKFAQVEMVLGGFANPDNRNQFYLQPGRRGEKLHFGYMSCEGGPPAWPYIDVGQADLAVEFKFDGINEKHSPFDALRTAFYKAIKKQLFVGRTFWLEVPKLTSLERLPLKIVVKGKPIPGWVDHSDMWADPSQFFDRASPEYTAYCLTLRSEKTRAQLAEMRRHSPDLDATWRAAQDAQIKLKAA